MDVMERLAPELPYLEVFHAVCREGGFTAAAHRLGRTQPAISYQVHVLEGLLKTKLIERGGRRLLLTPAGQRVRDFCQQVFGDLARVRAECAAGHRLEPLRIGSASGFGRYVLVPALHALRETADGRGLEIRVRFDAADVVLHDLQRGDYEAAFLYTRRISNVLRYHPVYDEELVLISSPLRQPLAPDELDRLEAFHAVPFVTYDEGDYVFGRWFDTNFGQQPDALRSVSRFSELEEVIGLVRRGVGWSIVPRDSVEGACARGDVEICYAGRRVPCLNQVFMVVRSGSVVRPELHRLAAFLRRPDR
jgi:DNA-binding transcriptional LysR family regulator